MPRHPPHAPICALHHTSAAHRWQNPTCPRSGNNKPVPSCCPTSRPHCYRCGDDHTATFKECPTRPRPAVPSRPTSTEPQGPSPMDVAIDGDQAPSTPPGRAGPSQMDQLTPENPFQQALHAPVPLKACAAPSPWRNQARPQALQLVGYVPAMTNPPPESKCRQASSRFLISVIQRNCRGSWDGFLSLFESFKESHTFPSVVLLQDPPFSLARLPFFNGFVPFFLPVRKP